MNSVFLERLQNALVPHRTRIISHPVYARLERVEDLRRFMELHVFAVWDFMSLLKSLQRNLTCTEVPWFPEGDADTRFLINEIVVGEESDVNADGVRMSHFELYLSAMQQAGADTSVIERFITELRGGQSLETAGMLAGVPEAALDFMRFTFRIIASGKKHVQAAVFTFGREDLIPGMFYELVRRLDANEPGSISEFRYYLERHIEVDGGLHSELALRMTGLLCGDDEQKWTEATAAAVEGLEHRARLWDGVWESLTLKTT